MQYLLLIYTDESAFGKMSKADQEHGVASYMAYTQALRNAGALKDSSRLRPIADATTVRVANGKSQVLNGPYADTKEQLGGFFLIEAPDLDAALTWAARCPGAQHGAVEVRPIWSM